MIEAPTTALLAAAEASTAIPAAVEGLDFGWAGLILVFPAVSAALCGLMAAMRVRSKLPGAVTAVSLLAAFGTTLALYLNCPQDAARTIHLFDWIDFSWKGGS